MKNILILSVTLIISYGCVGSRSKTEDVSAIRQKFYDSSFADCIKLIDLINEEEIDKDSLLELKKLKASCFFGLKQYKPCISIINDIIDHYLLDSMIYKQRSDSYFYTKQYALAERDYTVLIDRFGLLSGYNMRGLLYSHLKEYKLALEDFDSALKINPFYVEAINNKGVVLYRQEDYRNALNFTFTALKYQENKIFYFNIAESYYKLEKNDSACIYWKKSISMNYTPAKISLAMKCKNK